MLCSILTLNTIWFLLANSSQIITCVSLSILTRVFQDLSTRRVMTVAPKQGGLYKLDPLAIGKTQATSCFNTAVSHSVPHSVVANKIAACKSSFLDVLHARLGHTSLSKMKHIADCKSHVSERFFCEICILAKSHRLPFNKSSITTNSPF